MTLSRPAAVRPAAPTPGAEQSIASYDALAAEYDDAEHRTTRELEKLSGRGLAASGLIARLDQDPLMVEVGSGTGALSCEIAATRPGGRLVLSDPAPRMLRRAEAAVAGFKGAPSTLAIRGTAEEILARLASPPAAILAGLADPYLNAALLVALRRACAPHTLIFCSLPSRRWAEAERRNRLRIASDRTRFRTRAGAVLYSRSFCLDAENLAGLFTAGGFKVVASGSEHMATADWDAAPEVAWVLARPRLQVALG